MAGIDLRGGASPSAASVPGQIVATEFHFTEQATAGSVSFPIIAVGVSGSIAYAITAVSQGAKSFTFAGDHDAEFLPGEPLTIAGSTGNDGPYTIASASTDGTHTTVVVVEALPSAVADGTISGDFVGSVTVAGDRRADIIDCDWFNIVGSTGNDGVYVASNITFVGGNTVITTSDGMPDATADGTVNPSQYRASLTIPAGSVPREVDVVLGHAWAATTAKVWVFDDADNVYAEQSLTTAPLDTPTSLIDSHPALAADTVLHVTVTTTLASSPITPTGDMVVRFVYATPPTSTDATFT